MRERLFGGLSRHSARSIEASAGGGRAENCPRTGACLGRFGAGPARLYATPVQKRRSAICFPPKWGSTAAAVFLTDELQIQKGSLDLNSGGGARIGAQWRSIWASGLDASEDCRKVVGKVGAYLQREFRKGSRSIRRRFAVRTEVALSTAARHDAAQGAKRAALAALARVAWPEPLTFTVGASFPASAAPGHRTRRRPKRRRAARGA